MALPLPNVVANVEAGGPMVTAMRGQNALAQSAMDNVIKGAQAQYAPYTTYADAASKLAYSQFVGPQTIASLLTNPAIRGSLDPATYNKLAGAIGSQLSGTNNALSMLPAPRPPGGALGSLFNRGQGQGMPGGMPGGMPPGFMPPGMMPPGAGGGAPPGAFGGPPIDQGGGMPSGAPDTQPVPNTQGAQIGPRTPATQQAAGGIVPGTMGGNTPQTAQDVQEQSAKAAGVGQVGNQLALNLDDQKIAKAQAATAVDLANSVKQFDTNFKKSPTRGPGLGGLNPFGLVAGMLHIAGINMTAPQLVATGKSDVLSLLAPLRKQGYITDANMDLFSGMKLEPRMTDEAEDIMKEGLLASCTRMGEYQDFYNKVTGDNPDITNNEMNALWRQYNLQYPPFDKMNQVVNKKFENKWQPFATKEALAEYRKTGSYFAPTIPDVAPEKVDAINKRLSKYTDQQWQDTATKHGISVEAAKKHAYDMLLKQGKVP